MSLWFSRKDEDDRRKLYSVTVPWLLIVGLIVVLVLTAVSVLGTFGEWFVQWLRLWVE
jgi:hypothetical protein